MTSACSVIREAYVPLTRLEKLPVYSIPSLWEDSDQDARVGLDGTAVAGLFKGYICE